MTMIFRTDIIQGKPEWHTEKLGVPSSSHMDCIITPGGKPSKQKEGYLYTLAAERISGMSAPSYQSQAMADGLEKEAKSRLLYELMFDVEVEQVGVIYQNEDRKYLASPDGIINREYGLELKNVLPKTQVKYLLDGKLPSEYIVQVQASIFISGFTRWDFMSVSEGLPPLIIEVKRDDKFCAALKVELESFCEELNQVTDKLRKLS